jgi:hypothetical protein
LDANDFVYQIKWEGPNIAEVGTQDYPFFVDNQKFDNKHSLWFVFPNIFNIEYNSAILIRLLYDPSKNNPLQGMFFSGRAQITHSNMIKTRMESLNLQIHVYLQHQLNKLK